MPVFRAVMFALVLMLFWGMVRVLPAMHVSAQAASSHAARAYAAAGTRA